MIPFYSLVPVFGISISEQLKIYFNHRNTLISLLSNTLTDEQLALLMQYASNDFARWDAAQSLLSIYIKENVVRQQQREDLILPQHIIDAFKSVLLDEACDPALRGCRKSSCYRLRSVLFVLNTDLLWPYSLAN